MPEIGRGSQNFGRCGAQRIEDFFSRLNIKCCVAVGQVVDHAQGEGIDHVLWTFPDQNDMRDASSSEFARCPLDDARHARWLEVIMDDGDLHRVRQVDWRVIAEPLER